MKHRFSECPRSAWSLAILLLASLPSFSAQSQPGVTPQSAPVGGAAVDKSGAVGRDVASNELPVGAGDLLLVSMFGTKDFDQELRVSNTGEISLPLIGALSVAGLSPTQTAQLIGNKLIEGHFYNHPQLSVFVREYATEGIYVLGEVQKPGSYSILTAHNVLQAISLAGGTTPKAGRTVSITNPSRPHPVTASLNIAQPDNSGAPLTDPVKLLSGDTLVVSRAGIVYVVGDVRTPSGIVMDNPNLTVVEAIALAQGTNPTASLDRARLIRRGPDGPKEVAIPLKKMLAAEVADMPVQADDVIFVPTSKARTASRRGLEAILQAATGVAMYARY